jgi:FkbM family methyltransferase
MTCALARLQRSILYRLIVRSSSAGIYGSIGRCCGHSLGWPLPGGARIIIDNPAETIQRQILSMGVYEPGVVRVMCSVLRPGDLFLDIGANIGQYTLIAGGLGMRVHAFEPVPRLATRLAESVRLSRLEARVRIVPLAVSNRTGFSSLYISQRDDDGSHSLLPGIPARSTQRITVQTTTLDSYVSSSACGVPSIIKIDVEGCEALVLDGATAALANSPHPVIVLETGDRMADRIGESAATVLRRLHSIGYRTFLIPDDDRQTTEISSGHVPGELANYIAIHSDTREHDRLLAAFQDAGR